MDPHPCLVELAQAGSESLRAGLVDVPSHERDFLEAWWQVPHCSIAPPRNLIHPASSRDTLSNYASSTNTPALSRTPSSLVGMVSNSSSRHFGSASASFAGLSEPPSDTLVMSPGPNGGCKDLLRSIPLDSVLYELELILSELKSTSRAFSNSYDTRYASFAFHFPRILMSDILGSPGSPRSFTSATSSSGTISSLATPHSTTFFHAPPGATAYGLSPMQQLVAEGARSKGVGLRSAGRARAGSFAVRGIV
ncbi:hypothetical protein BDV93DRAFT_339350 [Ceratobasidium sp. AG-I]|nr:hypothetical protein BDV93DRAFT_339350 [Ceratobasidium sp. AG-I]